MEALIREYKQEHLPQIERIARTSFQLDRFHTDKKWDPKKADEYWAKAAVSNCKDKDAVTFVAQTNEKVVGFISIRESKELSDQFEIKHGSINMLGVETSSQGHGIGQRLVKRALQFFEENGFKKVDVGTDVHNFPAIRTYEKCGFTAAHFSMSLTIDL